MKNLTKPITLWLGALIVVATALLVFEADLFWKIQQHNVFLNTSEFFQQTMAMPGGFCSIWHHSLPSIPIIPGWA